MPAGEKFRDFSSSTTLSKSMCFQKNLNNNVNMALNLVLISCFQKWHPLKENTAVRQAKQPDFCEFLGVSHNFLPGKNLGQTGNNQLQVSGNYMIYVGQTFFLFVCTTNSYYFFLKVHHQVDSRFSWRFQQSQAFKSLTKGCTCTSYHMATCQNAPNNAQTHLEIESIFQLWI